jgi:hypothetical protein
LPAEAPRHYRHACCRRNRQAASDRSGGLQWWWRIGYRVSDERVVASADEIRIPTDRAIEFALKSADVIHSFWGAGARRQGRHGPAARPICASRLIGRACFEDNAPSTAAALTH